MPVPVIAPIVGTIASAIPGKMERMYRNDIKADRARLASGHGGMTAGQRGTAMAEGMNQIQAQQAAQTAQLARGSAMGEGASGQRDAAVLATNKAAQAGANTVASDVRSQDLALGEAQRQQLYARMAQARAWGQQRKQESLANAKEAEVGLQQAAAEAGGGGKLSGTSILNAWGK